MPIKDICRHGNYRLAFLIIFKVGDSVHFRAKRHQSQLGQLEMLQAEGNSHNGDA